ncbi:MAG: rhomboid family intramembrane serine protease [Verrucomicrobiota bacterium]|jgi:membrane associated rhomboid family serine protease
MNEPLAPCTSLLLLLTGVVSFLQFQNPRLEEKFIFSPERILARKEYYRLLSPAFLHAGWEHLLLNLISLYAFGSVLEVSLGQGQFLLIYFGAVIGGNLLSLYVHRHHDYRAYGASGGVCGIIFAFILRFPGGRITPLFISQLSIPAWIYAPGFMLLSFYGLKRNKDNIGHDAHLGGAIVGLLITAALRPRLVRAHWEVFLLVLGGAILLLVYLWFNSLGLPLSAFFTRRRRKTSPPQYRQQDLEVDAILEKISGQGVDSLTAEERALLEQASGQYRRREESKKPESGLAV